MSVEKEVIENEEVETEETVEVEDSSVETEETSEEDSEETEEVVQRDETLIGRVHNGDWAGLKTDFDQIIAKKIHDKVQSKKDELLSKIRGV